MSGFQLEQELPEAESEAPPPRIAVVDSRGVITAVNEPWMRFGRENGLVGDLIGASYLDACEQAVRAGGDESAQAALVGIREVLEGARADFSVVYPCHGPAEERWFRLHVTRFADGAPGAALLTHEDITSRRRIERRLGATVHLLEKVLETLPVGVWIMDASGQIVRGNTAAQRIWGGARFVGPDRFGEYRAWRLSTGEPIRGDEWAAARAVTRGEVTVDEELAIECFDGTHKLILNSAMPLRGAAGTIEGAIIVNQDISARKRAEEELVHANAKLEAARAELEAALARERGLSRSDPLTGAGNRRHFFDLAAQEVTVAKRYGHPLSVLIFDVDRFKEINDRAGHAAGDETLRAVVDTARRHLRSADVLARYGGDEFVVLLPQTFAAGARLVADRIREEISASPSPLPVTISCGVAEMLPEDRSIEPVLLRADAALYEAKRAGRNRTAESSPGAGARQAEAELSVSRRPA